MCIFNFQHTNLWLFLCRAHSQILILCFCFCCCPDMTDTTKKNVLLETSAGPITLELYW